MVCKDWGAGRKKGPRISGEMGDRGLYFALKDIHRGGGSEVLPGRNEILFILCVCVHECVS